MTIERALLEHRVELLAEIRRGRVRAGLREELADFLDRQLAAAAARAMGAGRVRRERSAKIEAGIRAALERVSPQVDVRDAISIVKRKLTHAPGDFGLNAPPCDRVLARVVNELRKKSLT